MPISSAQLVYPLDRWRSKNFFLKPGYAARPKPAYFTDVPDDGIIWQPDVYPIAARFAKKLGAGTIIDIGCGRALKLARLHEQHPGWDFIGVDYGPNIDWCHRHYDFGTWIEANLEDGRTAAFSARAGEKAVVICSDVLEHLVNPAPLLRAIRKLLSRGAAVAVFSTPERDLTRGENDLGPPGNPCHVREWNLAEFSALLQWAGFDLIHLGLTRSNDAGTDEKTILAVTGYEGGRDCSRCEITGPGKLA